MKTKNYHLIALYILLVLFSLLGNLFYLELFLGVDFIFSSVFIFIILHFFGPKKAFLAAAAVNLYTIVIWDNVFGYLTLLAETAFVSHFYSNKKRKLIVWDGVFLLFIGMPLSFLFSTVFLDLDTMNALLIMLKQSVNMLFNVLIANILLIMCDAMLLSKRKRKVSLQEILFNLMMLFFLFPLIGSLIYMGQKDLLTVKNDIQKQAEAAESSVSYHMNDFYHQHVSPLLGVADRIKFSEGDATLKVKNDLILVQHSFPNYKALYVADKSNHIHALRIRNIFRDFKPNPGISHIRSHEIELTDLYLSSPPHSEHLISLSVPVEKNKELYGYVVGVMKPVSFLNIIQTNSVNNSLITILDSQNRVILSNHPGYETGERFKKPSNEIFLDKLLDLKTNGSISTLQDWTTMSYSANVSIGTDVPWRIHLSIPVESYKKELYQKFISMFAFAYLFSLLAFVISYVISRWMQSALMKLAKITTNLPDKIFLNDKIDWPDAAVRETAHIVHNFKVTEKKLKKMVHEMMKQKEDLAFLAHFDPLTNLYNRTFFMRQLQDKMSDSSTSNLALLFIDLDRFKIVNDTIGHEAGDLLLSEIASRLLKKTNGTCTIARLGGDEFVILLPYNERKEDVRLLADTLINALSRPYLLDGSEFHLSASIGISLFPQDALDALTLIKNADIAMYDAKEKGKNNYQFYNTSINDQMLTKIQLENELRHAIEMKQLELYYQPQVCVASGKITGAEALLRWIHPEFGFVSPAVFIPIAEETGQIIELGEYVLKTACNEAQKWHNDGLDHMTVAVNISMRQFLHEDLLPSITEALAESGLDASHLKLEITETAAMRQPELVLKKLNELKNMKIELALDDFGTGYSSLQYLREMPVDIIKIDRSFIAEIEKNPVDSAIVHALIEVAHKLEKKVVAEGVETEAQKTLLAEMQCDIYQGYVFSRPLPGREFKKILQHDCLEVVL